MGRDALYYGKYGYFTLHIRLNISGRLGRSKGIVCSGPEVKGVVTLPHWDRRAIIRAVLKGRGYTITIHHAWID